MGMILVLTTLSDENLRRVLADPPLVWKVLAPDDSEPYDDARNEAGEGGSDDDVVLGDGEGEEDDLDKAWHGIHFLLTASAWEGQPPLHFLVAGGTPVGDIDVGYGPARVLTSAEVASVHRALSELPDDTLRARFDPAAFQQADIYPGIWDRDSKEHDLLLYLMDYLGTLRAFLERAVAARMGLVISVT